MPRRPGNFAFNAAAAASLLLCVALLLGWARAQFGDVMWVRFVGHSLVLYGADGSEAGNARLYFFEPSGSPVYEGPDGLLRLLSVGTMGSTGGSFAGVEFYRDATRPVPRYRAVVVPVAYPALLTAAL